MSLQTKGVAAAVIALLAVSGVWAAEGRNAWEQDLAGAGKMVLAQIKTMSAAREPTMPEVRPAFNGILGAFAQDSTQVHCASHGYRYQTCGTGQRYAHVVLERRLSDSPCVEGRSWGYWESTIWVDKGCSAIFRVYPGRETYVDCASHRYGRRTCGTGMWNIRVIGVSQRSDTACIQGDTWGHDGGSVWVDRGCRAVFHVIGFPYSGR